MTIHNLCTYAGNDENPMWKLHATITTCVTPPYILFRGVTHVVMLLLHGISIWARSRVLEQLHLMGMLTLSLH